VIKKNSLILTVGLWGFTTLRINPTDNPEIQIANPPAAQDVIVNVYIHGILKPVMDLGDTIKIAKQKIKRSRYKYATEYIRKHSAMSRVQAMQAVGLVPIQMQVDENNNGSRALVAVFRKLNEIMEIPKVKTYNYTFGWSGLLSYASRQKAAFFLHAKLNRLVRHLRKRGLNPIIKIYSFSHGGNVALQLANFEPWKPNGKLNIAQLVMLGTPIQHDNDTLILHPMFQSIYHFYSNGDIPQKLDFVSTQYKASYRRFHARKCFELPSKLTQIQIRLSKKTIKQTPEIPSIKHSTTTYDPSHIEMWTFGWTPQGYDRRLPIFPLPVVAITPYLIQAIKDHPHLGTNLVANINPDKARITFTDRNWHDHKLKQVVKVPFLSRKQFREIRQAAWTRRAMAQTNAYVQRIVNNAVRFATRQRQLLTHCAKTLRCPIKYQPKLQELR
jgi:hypothetical protein